MGDTEPVTMAAHQNWGWERRQVSQELLTEEHGVPDFSGALTAGTVQGLVKRQSLTPSV